MTAVVGAELAKRALKKIDPEDKNGEIAKEAQKNKKRVQELEMEVQELQEQMEHLKKQAFSVPWPPAAPPHNPDEPSPIINGDKPHFPKGN